MDSVTAYGISIETLDLWHSTDSDENDHFLFAGLRNVTDLKIRCRLLWLDYVHTQHNAPVWWHGRNGENSCQSERGHSFLCAKRQNNKVEKSFFFWVNSRAASQIWKSLLDSGELRLCKFSSSALIDVNPLFLLLTPHPKQLQTIFCFTKTIKGKKPFFLFNCKRKLWICAWRTGTRDQYWCKINRYWAFVRNSLCCFGYPEEGGAVPGQESLEWTLAIQTMFVACT